MSDYKPGDRVICPHCNTKVKLENPSNKWDWNNWRAIVGSPKYQVSTIHAQCPECLRFIVSLDEEKINPANNTYVLETSITLWPFMTSRHAVPPEVTSDIAQDYTEAAQVLNLSPKASAALSRRCLQSVLREKGNTKSKDLATQIDEVLPSLPTRIAENLDAVRVIGNFAAHPLKSDATGTIVDVEIGEAEWNLDVLDALFDYYYVRPEMELKKRDALNKKLADAGKPPLK